MPIPTAATNASMPLAGQECPTALMTPIAPMAAPAGVARQLGLTGGWRWAGVALAVAAGALVGCGAKPDHSKPGWYLEKTGPTAVALVQVTNNGERKTWEGQLTDGSPQGGVLSPLPVGQDNGLFRWSRAGCADLSFVLSKAGLTCTTCMEPVVFVPYTASCPVDQTRLPVQGWTAIGFKRAN